MVFHFIGPCRCCSSTDRFDSVFGDLGYENLSQLSVDDPLPD